MKNEQRCCEVRGLPERNFCTSGSDEVSFFEEHIHEIAQLRRTYFAKIITCPNEGLIELHQAAEVARRRLHPERALQPRDVCPCIALSVDAHRLVRESRHLPLGKLPNVPRPGSSRIRWRRVVGDVAFSAVQVGHEFEYDCRPERPVR